MITVFLLPPLAARVLCVCARALPGSCPEKSSHLAAFYQRYLWLCCWKRVHGIQINISARITHSQAITMCLYLSLLAEQRLRGRGVSWRAERSRSSIVHIPALMTLCNIRRVVWLLSLVTTHHKKPFCLTCNQIRYFLNNWVQETCQLSFSLILCKVLLIPAIPLTWLRSMTVFLHPVMKFLILCQRLLRKNLTECSAGATKQDEMGLQHSFTPSVPLV